MGCDIHLYAEKKRKNKEYWDSVLDVNNSGIRDYDMFGFLANGVRFSPDIEKYNPHDVNGLPDDCDYVTRRASLLAITDKYGDWEDYTSSENARKWHEYGCKYYKSERNTIPFTVTEVDDIPLDVDANNIMYFVEHPDWHSHSHISLSEYKDLLLQYVNYCNETYCTEEVVKETAEGFLDCDTESYWVALYNMLHSYERGGCEVRLVYWFDN